MKNLIFSNKLLSSIINGVNLVYLIPKMITKIHWLNSGVVNSYFYLIASINLFIFIIGTTSLLSFRKANSNKQNIALLVFNVVGIIILVIWLPFIYTS